MAGENEDFIRVSRNDSIHFLWPTQISISITKSNVQKVCGKYEEILLDRCYRIFIVSWAIDTDDLDTSSREIPLACTCTTRSAHHAVMANIPQCRWFSPEKCPRSTSITTILNSFAFSFLMPEASEASESGIRLAGEGVGVDSHGSCKKNSMGKTHTCLDLVFYG